MLVAATLGGAPSAAVADETVRIVKYKFDDVGTQKEDGKFAGRVAKSQLPTPPVPVVGVNARGAVRIEPAGSSTPLFIDRFDVEIEPKAKTRSTIEICKLLAQQNAANTAGQGQSTGRRQSGSMGIAKGCEAEGS